MGENEASEKGLRFKIKYKRHRTNWTSSKRVGENCSGYKVLIEEETWSDIVLTSGPHAEEFINIFSMAIRLGHTAEELKKALLYSYPTNSSDIVYMV